MEIDNLEHFISLMIRDMVLEEKTENLTVYHGSHKDDEIEYTSFYDIHRNVWTTYDKAVEGYILNRIKPIITKLTK